MSTNVLESSGVLESSARSGFALGLSLGLVLASSLFLAWPELATRARTAVSAPVPAASPAPATLAAPGAAAGSMEAATLARAHKASADGGLRDAIAASAMLLSAPHRSTGAAQAGPDSTATILASAEDHRRKREFKEACAAYAEAARLGAMTADSWADYADAQASLAGRLAGEPEKAIARALELDPKQPKALWLKASLAHEQHRYKEALATWRQLLAVVPPGSSDARIVEANIAEASRLAKG